MPYKDLFRTRLRDLQPHTKDQANKSAQWPKNADSRNSLVIRVKKMSISNIKLIFSGFDEVIQMFFYEHLTLTKKAWTWIWRNLLKLELQAGKSFNKCWIARFGLLNHMEGGKFCLCNLYKGSDLFCKHSNFVDLQPGQAQTCTFGIVSFQWYFWGVRILWCME